MLDDDFMPSEFIGFYNEVKVNFLEDFLMA